MENIFLEKQKQQERIQFFQNEIEKLLQQRPELIPIQKELSQQLDKIGDLSSEEGRQNRATFAFSMMRESFLKMRESLLEFKRESEKERVSSSSRPLLTVVRTEPAD